MPVRRASHRHATSVAELIDRLPERFWEPVPEVEHGNMTGLHRYMTDLAGWIDVQLGTTSQGPQGRSRGRDLAPEVMRAIGADPAQWYREMLSG